MDTLFHYTGATEQPYVSWLPVKTHKPTRYTLYLKQERHRIEKYSDLWCQFLNVDHSKTEPSLGLE